MNTQEHDHGRIHNPETIDIIVADELAALKQRRAEHQQGTGQEVQA
ncbi:hypothetical protein [Brachybacterium alimentarium]